MSIQSYEKYDDSGIEWLGKLPEHWLSCKIKFNTYVKGRIGWHGLNANEFKETGIHLVTGTDFDNGIIAWERCYRISEERYLEDPYIQLKENDILITKDGTIGKLARVRGLPGKASLNSGIFLLRAEKQAYSEEFLYWILQSSLFSCFMDLHKTGSTIQHLYQEVINQFAFPIPPLLEQTAISAYLESETMKVDALIAKKQRLIELLKEKRQAIISHAVTKGLNPKVPMKDSGIEWLGMIPTHWDSTSIRRIALSVQTGATPPLMDSDLELEEGVAWYTPGDFGNSSYLKESTRKISCAVAASGEARLFPPGTVLIVSIGATLGKVGYIDQTSSANQQINAVTPNERIDGYFLTYSLSVKAELMRFLSNSSTIGIMNQEKTKEIWLAAPPLDEQKEITSYLDHNTSKIDTLICEVNNGIILLQERRTALISAAVTGKIDVRGTIKQETS